MKNNRKGFTIVELVIVIAAIAILIGVMLPTFSEVIDKARDAAALQWATMAYKAALADVMADGEISSGEIASAYGFTFTFTDVQNATARGEDNVPAGFAYNVKVENGKVSVDP